MGISYLSFRLIIYSLFISDTIVYSVSYFCSYHTFKLENFEIMKTFWMPYNE